MKAMRDVVTSAAPPVPGRTGLVIDLGDEEDRAYLRDGATALPDVLVCLLATDTEPPVWLDPLARELGSRCVLVVVRTPPRTGSLVGRPRSPWRLGAAVGEAFDAAGAEGVRAGSEGVEISARSTAS